MMRGENRGTGGAMCTAARCGRPGPEQDRAFLLRQPAAMRAGAREDRQVV